MAENHERRRRIAAGVRFGFALYAIHTLAAYYASLLATSSAISRDLQFNLSDTVFLFASGSLATSLMPFYGQFMAWTGDANMKTLGYIWSAGFLVIASYATRPSSLLIAIVCSHVGLAAVGTASISILCETPTKPRILHLAIALLPVLFILGLILGSVGVETRDWRWVLRGWAIKTALKALLLGCLRWILPHHHSPVHLKDAPVDYWGSLYWTLAVGLLIWCASFAAVEPEYVPQYVIILTLSLGILFLISLLVLERRTNAAVAIFPRYLLTRSVWMLLVIVLLVSMGLGVYLLYVFKVFRNIANYDEYAVTQRFIAFALASSLGLACSPILLRHFEGPHVLLVVTPLMSVGILLFSFVGQGNRSVQLGFGIPSTLLAGLGSAIAYYMIFATTLSTAPNEKRQLLIIYCMIVCIGLGLGPAATSTLVGASTNRIRRIKGIQRTLWVAAVLPFLACLLTVAYCIANAIKSGERDSDTEATGSDASETISQRAAVEGLRETDGADATGDTAPGGSGAADLKRRTSYVVSKPGQRRARLHKVGTETLRRILKKPSALEALPQRLEEQVAVAAAATDPPTDDPGAAPGTHRGSTNEVPKTDAVSHLRRLFQPR